MQRSSVSVICYFSVRAKFMARHSLPRVIQQFDVPFNNQIYIYILNSHLTQIQKEMKRERRERRERERR
jgi:hypothetical protein